MEVSPGFLWTMSSEYTSCSQVEAGGTVTNGRQQQAVFASSAIAMLRSLPADLPVPVALFQLPGLQAQLMHVGFISAFGGDLHNSMGICVSAVVHTMRLNPSPQAATFTEAPMKKAAFLDPTCSGQKNLSIRFTKEPESQSDLQHLLQRS